MNYFFEKKFFDPKHQAAGDKKKKLSFPARGMAIQKGKCCALASNPDIKDVQSMNIRARGRGEGIRGVFLV